MCICKFSNALSKPQTQAKFQAPARRCLGAGAEAEDGKHSEGLGKIPIHTHTYIHQPFVRMPLSIKNICTDKNIWDTLYKNYDQIEIEIELKYKYGNESKIFEDFCTSFLF